MPLQNDNKTSKIMFLATKIDWAKIMLEKAKTKTSLQQRVSLRIILPKIILLQSDTKALKIMSPTAKNDSAKSAKNKAKNKTNLLHYISLHITVP